MTRNQLAILVIPNLTFLTILLAARVDRFTPTVCTLKLADCYLDYHTQAVTLACPGGIAYACGRSGSRGRTRRIGRRGGML